MIWFILWYISGLGFFTLGEYLFNDETTLQDVLIGLTAGGVGGLIWGIVVLFLYIYNNYDKVVFTWGDKDE